MGGAEKPSCAADPPAHRGRARGTEDSSTQASSAASEEQVVEAGHRQNERRKVVGHRFGGGLTERATNLFICARVPGE